MHIHKYVNNLQFDYLNMLIIYNLHRLRKRSHFIWIILIEMNITPPLSFIPIPVFTWRMRMVPLVQQTTKNEEFCRSGDLENAS